MIAYTSWHFCLIVLALFASFTWRLRLFFSNLIGIGPLWCGFFFVSFSFSTSFSLMSTSSSATLSEGINTASGSQELAMMVGLCWMGSCEWSRLTSCSKFMVESSGEISGDIPVDKRRLLGESLIESDEFCWYWQGFDELVEATRRLGSEGEEIEEQTSIRRWDMVAVFDESSSTNSRVGVEQIRSRVGLDRRKEGSRWRCKYCSKATWR